MNKIQMPEQWITVRELYPKQDFVNNRNWEFDKTTSTTFDTIITIAPTFDCVNTTEAI